ncbi:hypothetical protein QUF72_21925 [Desulfobacterales bacterium HSG2]|nr:hypothetical protein [Desulfobacterales bacterium HSG2]
MYFSTFPKYLPCLLAVILLLPVTALGLPGDMNGSGRVDGYDLIMFGLANGSGTGDENWNPDADLDKDGSIDTGGP